MNDKREKIVTELTKGILEQVKDAIGSLWAEASVEVLNETMKDYIEVKINGYHNGMEVELIGECHTVLTKNLSDLVTGFIEETKGFTESGFYLDDPNKLLEEVSSIADDMDKQSKRLREYLSSLAKD